jgi:malate dehydrogenase (oxaloacetate-decarboxylating)
VQAQAINDEMKMAAAQAIAGLVPEGDLGPEALIPDSLDLRVAPRVAAAVAQAAHETGVARIDIVPHDIESRCRDLVYEGATGF